MKKLKILYIILFIFLFLLLASCTKNISKSKSEKTDIITSIKLKKEIENNGINRLNIVKKKYIEVNYDGFNLVDRYKTPEGYERIVVQEGSFGEYLRNKRLKPYGHKVLYHNGRSKSSKGVYDSVYDYNIGDKNLHQAADAIMLLRADYLFNNKMYNSICFSFVNGFKAEYSKWMAGYRIRINDNEASWYKDAEQVCTYDNLMKYMNMIFAYCSTISLEKDLISVNIGDMQIGDVFINPKMSGHAVIVVDMAINSKTGRKIFMLAQSGSPAQQTQILINPNNPEISPWYELDNKDELITPEWTFISNELMRFK